MHVASRSRIALTIAGALPVGLSLIATFYVALGYAPRLFNQQAGAISQLNIDLIAVCLLFLVLLVLSLFVRRFAWAGRIVLILIACVVVEELALTFYDRHAISNAHSKHAEALYSVFTHGGTFYLDQPNELSSLGFRTMRAEPKVAPGRRVLLLGDSFIVGTGGSFNSNYAPVLESELRTQFPSENITVFPAGVNGSGLEEQRYLFDYLLDQGYKFDAVVIHFFLGGDQVNNVRGTTRVSIDGRPSRIHNNPLLHYFYPLNFTAFRFFVSQNATQHASEWHPGAVLLQPTASCTANPGFQAYMAETSRFSYGPGAQQRVDMPYVLKLLGDLSNEVRSRNLPLALVILPDENREIDSQRQRLLGEPMNYDWIRNAVTANVSQNYPMLDLTDAFLNKPNLFQCNGIHWSDEGNVTAGKLVAPFVASHLISR